MGQQREGFSSFRLDNGMTVNLIVNRSAPLAEVHLYVRTGYAWEPDRLQGVSHVVEHNLMHGSPARPTREDFSRDRRSMGAWYDAGTTYDYTEYLMIVPARHLRAAMEMLSDGFFSARFTEEVFRSEMGAILQESKRKEDIPEPMVLEKLYSTAYRVHRRGRWRLGTEESLARIRLDDLTAYFDDRYGPGNITCTVGGDIDLDEAQCMVQEVFGSIPAKDVRGEDSPGEPPQDGVRYLEIPSSLSRVYWIAGFHVPAFLLEDGYHCFDLLAAVLGTGRGSRLAKQVKNKGLVDRVEARSAEFDEYMLFNVYAETDAERLPAAEEAILSEIFALGAHEVGPQELRRARTLAEAAVLMRQDDLRRHVEWLAVCEGRGGSVKQVDHYAELLEEASTADLRAWAEKCFTPANLSICMLRPEAVAARNPGDVSVVALRAEQKAKDITAVLASGAETGPSVPAAISTGILEAPGEPVRVTLANGAALVHRRSPGNPAFALAALFQGGRFQEDGTSSGLTALTLTSLLKGTSRMDADACARAVEELGVSLDPVITDDAWGFTLYGPAASFSRAAGILAEVLSDPALPGDAVVQERQALLARARAMADRPREYALERFKQALFRDHPYGLPRPGRAESLAGFDAARVAAWHRSLLAGSNLVLSLSADLPLETAQKQLDGLFGSLPAGERVVPPPFDPAVLSYPELVKVEQSQRQTTTVVGYPTVAATADDVHALDLVSYFCQGDGGRFYDEIRGKRGLAYVVHAIHTAHLAGGHFLGFSATAHDKAAEARDIFLKEYAALAESPPDAEELARTVEFCLGMRTVRHRRTSLQRSLALAEAEIRGQGFRFEVDYEEKLRAVTPEAFLAAARRYFKPDGHVQVMVGP